MSKKTITEMCQLTGISSKTVRKYTKEFAELIPHTVEGPKQVFMYDDAAVKVLAKIKELYKKDSIEAIKTALTTKGGKKAGKATAKTSKEHQEKEPMSIGAVSYDEQDPGFW